jgi:hypothetical protein
MAVAAFGLYGCGHSVARSTIKPAPPKDAVQPDHAAVGNKIEIRWHEKTDRGTIRRVLDVDAETGDLKPRSESGTLNRATGLIYQDDQPKARFKAPTVVANRENDQITARGGVTITSIDPPGITVTADKITWSAAKNRIVAEGNVKFVQMRPGHPKPVSQGQFDRITVDTAMKTFTYP